METRIHEIKVNEIEENDMVIDIETTGFSPDYCTISSISYLFYSGNKFIIKQLFSEDGRDLALLNTFLQDLNPNHRIISFNGERFDIPFINKRLKSNNIDKTVENKSLDLYAYLKENKDFSPYPAIGQKKLEILYGIERKSDLDGKKAVQMYKSYLISKKQEIKEDLLYYNYLDVYYLSKLISIYYEVQDRKKITIQKKEFFIEKLLIKKDILSIDLSTQAKSPYPIDIINSSFRLLWEEQPRLELDLVHGLISPQLTGSAFASPRDLKLIDKSPYGLNQNLILIKDETFNTINIKNVCKAILEHSLEDYMEDIC